MQKLTLKAVSVAALAFVAGAANAAVNLDTGVVTTGTFAKELNYAKTTGTAITGSAASTGVTTKLGFGVSGGQDRYIRVDLNGAALAAAAAGTDVASGGAAYANSTVVAGGAAGDTFIIYQITANALGHAASELVGILIPSVNVTNGNAATATVTYALYETAVAAVNNAAGTSLYKASGDFLKFASGLNWKLTPGSNVASVEKSFKEFTAASVAVDTANIGKFEYAAAAGVLKADGTAVALADLVTAATKVNFAGDFGASKDDGATPPVFDGVFVDNNDACATTAATLTLNTAKTSASYTVGTTADTANLCYKVSKATAIAAQTVTAALDVTAATGTTTADVAAGTIGTITRDGTELQSPWFSTVDGYISRFFLTNMHTADAAYTAAVVTEDGNVCTTGTGTAGTLKAGKQLAIAATDICSAMSAGSRAAVVFTIAAPNSKIQGVYNIVNATTGSISVSNLIRPGTN